MAYLFYINSKFCPTSSELYWIQAALLLSFGCWLPMYRLEFKWGLSVNKWSDVKCSDVEWTDVIYVKWMFFLNLSKVKWVTVKYLETKVPCTSKRPYTEGTWLYCDYFIWCVSCTVAVLTCFVMFECCNVWVCVCVGVFVIWENCIYCVLYCLYCIFVLYLLCIFILICTTATE
jgi:hypothetical protein